MTVFNANVIALAPSGGDDTAALQAAITTDCQVLLGAGTFLLSTAPIALPRNAVGIHIQGQGPGVTTIRLSAAAPRAFDFNKVADGDIFQNIELSDFTVDAAKVLGRHHTIIGTYQAGTNQTNLSFRHLRVRRVNVVNAESCSTLGNYETSTNHRLCAHIAPTNHAAGELSDIAFEDCRLEGGNEGIFVGVGGSPETEATMDDVHIRRCWHSTMAAPAQFFASANFQLGSYARGGSISIEDCRGYYSGDVGIEVDGFTSCTVRDTQIEDAYDYDFYFTNFTKPVDEVNQSLTYTRCVGRKALVAHSLGWQFSNSNEVTSTLGTITLRDCKFNDTSVGFTTQGEVVRSTTANIRLLTIENLRVDQPNKDYSGAGAGSPIAISLSTQSNLAVNKVALRGIFLNLTAAHSGAGSYTWAPIQLLGNVYVVDWQDVRVIFNNQGALLNHTFLGINLGPSATTVKHAVIAGYVPVIEGNGDQGAQGITLGNTTHLNITDRILVSDSDFSGMGSGGGRKELNFEAGGTGANQQKVHLRSPRMMSAFPVKPTAITVTASPFVYENLDGYPEVVAVKGGTVSKIEYSNNAAGNYTDTGATAGVFTLYDGDFLKVTWAVEPTMTKIPLNK